MIDKVVMREEVYQPGRQDVYERAADLFALPYDGYDLKGNVNKSSLTEKSALAGMHTFGDAMLYIRGEEIVGEDLSIVDLMPTILQIMGVPAPEDLDGASCIRRP
jgi:predicted AlkP superfamily phosphohydrolase/phosphomutase